MDGGEESALARDVAAAIAWWRDAGVDLCFDDEPARWISPAQPTALAAERMRSELREAVPTGDRAPTPLPAPARGLRERTDGVDLASMPNNRAAFAEWWLAHPSLDDGRSGGRVAARWADGAALMVLVPEPEQDDADRLLVGRQGRLLAGLLGALGLAEDAVMVTSALPRHMPMPDWPDLAERGFGEVLARQVLLASPTHVIAFGSGVLSLLGNHLANSPASSTVFAQGEMMVPLFRARSLEAILARPAWKAELWNGLLDWMPTTSSATGKGTRA